MSIHTHPEGLSLPHGLPRLSAVHPGPIAVVVQGLLAPLALLLAPTGAAGSAAPEMTDPQAAEERTCFQTAEAFSEGGDLRADVAVVYGIDPALPKRLQTWKDRGYRVHVMTGVSWGNYQDYLYGRFDGQNHEDEAQTDRNGKKVSHGGDVYYMCPGQNYGKFLSVGVRRACEAGAEAIHLEEPEFWVRSGYSEGFKREWLDYYKEPWSAPHSSPEAQWRASKLKYYLYRRALQQVFDSVNAYNRETGRKVRCYVPTHSLLNYAHWRIVSPESSLAMLDGCDGYIAQVWTGTARTANVFKGKTRERTFETAFLEYGAMQNLVRSTGRRVWYLHDPVEDNPDHDWTDYKVNWEATVTASLFQPDVWRYEVAPWPERVFRGRYPKRGNPAEREGMPPAYATEVQLVTQALKDMNQRSAEWDCGTQGLGVLVSDSMMFQRGDPAPGDPHFGDFYGLAMPLVKRGIPVTPVQLENLPLPGYLNGFKTLFLTYHGLKPLSPAVHTALAHWVHDGGSLVVVDNDTDPYLGIREWWNQDGLHYPSPKAHLFAALGLPESLPDGDHKCGKGVLVHLKQRPADLASRADGDNILEAAARTATAKAGLKWVETNYLLLRRGRYLVAAGLEESPVDTGERTLKGRFIDLFDPELKVLNTIQLTPGKRVFALDLDRVLGKRPEVLAAACGMVPKRAEPHDLTWAVEGVANTPAVVLVRTDKAPKAVTLAGKPVGEFAFDPEQHLLRIHFDNTSEPRELALQF